MTLSRRTLLKSAGVAVAASLVPVGLLPAPTQGVAITTGVVYAKVAALTWVDYPERRFVLEGIDAYGNPVKEIYHI